MHNSTLNALYAFLFPPSCLGCGLRGTVLCKKCFLSIPPAQKPQHDQLFALYPYKHPLIQKILWSAKYHHSTEALKALTRYSIPAIHEYLADIMQVHTATSLTLLPIPLSRKKSSHRGYNVARIIAKTIVSEESSFIVRDILIKQKETLPQSHIKERHLRLENLTGTMELVETFEGVGIIIDDVTTTGGTCIEAIRACKEKGVTSVHCIALAHGS
jgi:predicted amidophosphoribosyltransferase